MIWQNSTYKAIDIFKSPFISFTIRIVVNSVNFYFYFYFFVQVYRNGVLINTLSLSFAPGRYTVSGLDPETSYRFAATVSNAVGRSRSPLYASAVTTVGMSLCGTRLMC